MVSDSDRPDLPSAAAIRVTIAAIAPVPPARSARSMSSAHATGVRPSFVREGGSIGAVLTMRERFGVPIVFMGLSLPEHGYHAPNEFFDWGQASAGMKAFVRYFEALASLKK